MNICLNKICVLLVLFFITSCGVKKNIVKELDTINVNEIVAKLNSHQINSNWLYLKGKIKVLSDKEKVTLGVSMKIRQDSLIWVSINAPIIGEINRIMITPDSLYMINRKNSTWLIKPIEQLKNQIGLLLSYKDIQAFVSNTVRIPNTELTNFSLNQDGYIIDNIDSTSYLIGSENKFIKEININYSQSQKLTIEYSNYFNNYAKRLNIFTSKPKLNVELIFNKIEERKIDKVSFKIPKGYEKIN
tara:strand:+ start:576 stop:1310 length:735 start_codon:yes stop_codon:yes gene_type:complete